MALIIVDLSCFVALANANGTTYYRNPVVSANGNNWSFKTVDQFTKVSFSGNLIDPNSILATYWNNGGSVTTVKPKNLVINNNQVSLVFDGSTLPTHIDNVKITRSLTDGSLFIGTGPGWTWGGVHS